jgi:hypothetical protein
VIMTEIKLRERQAGFLMILGAHRSYYSYEILHPSSILRASAAEMRFSGWNRISPHMTGRRGCRLGSLTRFLNCSSSSYGPWHCSLTLYC